MKQLICESLNGVRTTQIIWTTALCTPHRDASPWECIVAGTGVWGLESNTRARTAVDFGETAEGMGGRKSIWGMPLEESWEAMEVGHYYGESSHHSSLSLPTGQCQQLTNRERPQ